MFDFFKRCNHKWVLIDQFRGVDGFGLIVYRKTYQCEYCGKIIHEDYKP